MAGLKLCGVEVPITEASRSDYVAEDRGRAFDGTPRSVVRARKRELQLRAGPKSATWTDALRRLVNGEGHAFSFDADLYSSKGLGPSSQAGITRANTGGKFGGYISGAAPTSTITWPTALGSSWTAMLWRKASGAGAWVHYVVTSSGAKWVDGVRNDAAVTTFVAVSSGSLTVSTPSTSDHFDDVVALPFVVPDGWPAQLHAENNARAFPALPRLRAEGDLINAGPLTVLGQSGESDVFSFMDGGALVSAGESLSFSLSEV